MSLEGSSFDFLGVRVEARLDDHAVRNRVEKDFSFFSHEFLLQSSLRDLFRMRQRMLSRIRAAHALTRRAEFYEMDLGPNQRQNVEVDYPRPVGACPEAVHSDGCAPAGSQVGSPTNGSTDRTVKRAPSRALTAASSE